MTHVDVELSNIIYLFLAISSAENTRTFAIRKKHYCADGSKFNYIFTIYYKTTLIYMLKLNSKLNQHSVFKVDEAISKCYL